MDTATFLGSVLAPDGWYCVLALKENKRVQKFYNNLDALLHAANNFSDEGYDAYFGLGAFMDGRSRTADNVGEMRAFFMDLDCGVHLKTGEKKDYTDQNDALKALKAFVRINNLPKPTLVDSGYGIHVYWKLDDPVPLKDWQRVAFKLKTLAQQQGFKSDEGVTADAARVLRVPGTLNYKGEDTKTVHVLMSGEVTSLINFEKLLPDVAAPSGYIPSNKDSAMMDALMGNRRNVFKDIVKKTARGKGCAQIAHILQNRETLSEPMWRAGLSIAGFCEDRVKAAEIISKGHPDFDMDDTMHKMDRIKGPYQCARFDDYNPGVCPECPFWGKIKSPIVLGSEVKEAPPDEEVVADVSQPASPLNTVTIPAYPKPYFRGANGGVYRRDIDDEGEVVERLIYVNDLYVVSRLKDPEAGEVLLMRLHMRHDPVQEFMVKLEQATSREEYRKVLSAQGVAVYGKQLDAIMEYTQAWINELQQSVQADTAQRQFGWVDEDMTCFALGNRLIYGDRVEKNAPSVTTAEYMKPFSGHGSLEVWKDAVNFWNQPGMELHQFIVCAGFGAPLMQLTPQNAALIHLWSKESGYGKSTVGAAAAGIWGRPDILITHSRDTYMSRMMRAEIYKNIPVIMDELTNIKSGDASDLIYQATDGRQRNRMAATGNTERFRGEPWQTLFITSANVSLIDRVTLSKSMAMGEAMRMLEIHVAKVTDKLDIPKSETDELNNILKQNYGVAALPFVQYVINHKDEVKALLDKVRTTIDRRAQLDQPARFWSAAASVIITASVICNKIGLLQFDSKNLMDYTINTILKTAKEGAKGQQTDPRSIINDYVYENWGKILQIRSTIDRRGTHMSGADDLVIPDSLPKGDIAGRYEPDTKMLYLRPAPLRQWLAEQQLNYQSLSADLKKMFGAERKNVRLTRGTHMNMPATMAICMQINIEDREGGDDDLTLSDA